MLRKSLKYKPYFMSKYNIFTTKYINFIHVDLPASISLDKMQEVLEESSF